MLLPTSLQRAHLIKRYKRFLADVRLETGEVVQAHCPNSGSMKGLCAPGEVIWINYVDNPKRKLKYSWELVEVGETLVGINTNRPNVLVKEALEAKKLSSFKSYEHIKAEAQYGPGTRLDFLLTGSNSGEKNAFVEVKNVTLKEGDKALFPDAVTTRGTKHLNTLMEALSKGYRSAIVFIVQREDVQSFSPAKDIDPVYFKTLKQAQEAGVEIYCYTCNMHLQSITIGAKLPIQIV